MAEQVSIVIPTILRASVLRTVKKCRGIAKASMGLAKVLVVVNCLEPNRGQKKTLRRLKRIQGIEIYFQEKYRVSAEQSAIHAAGFANTAWLWFMGDDDRPLEGALNHVRDLIHETDTDFWLLNCKLKAGSRTVPYYDVGPQKIQTSTGQRFFERLGLISATTTLSCWLIKREVINVDDFEAFHSVMGIYSHSFWLLSATYNKRAGLTDYKCLERNEEEPEVIAKSLSKYTSSIGKDLAYISIQISRAGNLLNWSSLRLFEFQFLEALEK